MLVVRIHASETVRLGRHKQRMLQLHAAQQSHIGMQKVDVRSA